MAVAIDPRGLGTSLRGDYVVVYLGNPAANTVTVSCTYTETA